MTELFSSSFSMFVFSLPFQFVKFLFVSENSYADDDDDEPIFSEQDLHRTSASATSTFANQNPARAWSPVPLPFDAPDPDVQAGEVEVDEEDDRLALIMEREAVLERIRTGQALLAPKTATSKVGSPG